MATVFAGIAFSVAMWSVAVWANGRFRDQARLPMQWWLNGEVTWSAPRRIGLAFIPAIVTPLLIGFGILLSVAQPRPGQEGMAVLSLIAFGLIAIGAQLFHLWMVGKTVRRNDG